MRDRSKNCWICGRPRGLEQKRKSWSLYPPCPGVPRTDNPEDRPAQISNDLIIYAGVNRNGGASDETHLCASCVAIGVRALRAALGEALGELDEADGLELQCVDLTRRLAAAQNRLDNVCYDHNRMQKRLKYTLSKVQPSCFEDDDELGYARWEVRRGPVARVVEAQDAAPLESEAEKLRTVLHEILEDERCAIPSSLRDRALDVLPCPTLGRKEEGGR